MSWLARLSLRNRGLTALVALLALVFGGICIPKLKQQLFPSLDFPAAVIVSNYQGAAPDIVDRQVTQPVTSAIQGVAGVERTTATSREGNSTVIVEFTFGTDLDRSVSKLDSALDRAKSQLPQNVTPTVMAGTTADLPVIVLAASSSADERSLADKLRGTVIPELERMDGVRTAAITGDRERVLAITPDLAKMAAAGIDPASIGAALRGNGLPAPVGALTEGAKTLSVQVGSAYTTIDDIRGLYLSPSAASAAPASVPPAGAAAVSAAPSAAPASAAPANRGPVRLADVAKVEEQLAEPTSITRTNGAVSLGISVTATPDGNAVQISDDIRKALPRLRTALGGDANLVPVFDQAPFVKKSISGLFREGLLGLVFAVLVILLFLASGRSTMVTAVSIPMSVVIALIALWAGDYSLNILTLGGLTIAIGRVVDDSIVVLENIKRHLAYGEDKYHAVTTAVREVAGAVSASTVTTVAVFTPIALVGGMVGELFSSFAITVTAALAASLLVSLTLIPVLAYWFLKPATAAGKPAAGTETPDPESGTEAEIAVETEAEQLRRLAEERERRSILQRGYVPVIRFATRRCWTTLAIGLVVFVATLGLAAGLKTNFFDHSGETSLTVTQTMPVGTSLAATDEAARKVEAILKDTAGVETYQATIGGGGGMFAMAAASGTNEASFSLTISDDVDAIGVRDRLRERLAGLAGAGELKVEAGGGGFSADQLEVIVEADDTEALAKATEQVRTAMAGTAGVAEVDSDLSSSVPRIEVSLRRDAAGRYGLTDTSVSQLVAAAIRGTQLGQVTVAGSAQTVLLRLGSAPANLAAIQAIPVTTAAGPVPLVQVADVRQVDGPVQISRIDGNRSATVKGTATGSNVGKTTQDLQEQLDKLTLPAGASFKMGGVSSDQSDAFGDLGLALLAAIAIVYLVMAATFRSLVQPLILLVSIPFAATGAIALLLATGTALGVPALIGMLMLVGIVVTNAIVLLDLVNKYRAAGMGVVEAVVEGGRHRLRPILMTAVATICALLPMALGLESSGGFISKPLAIVVIGGLISSTALTLVLVPTLYTMIEYRRERRAAKRLAGATV